MNLMNDDDDLESMNENNTNFRIACDYSVLADSLLSIYG